MLLEGLVAYSCLINSGCTEAIDSYYHYYPDVRENLRSYERDVKESINPTIINYAIPMAAFLVNGAYHTSVNGVGMEVGVNSSEQKYYLTFKKSF